ESAWQQYLLRGIEDAIADATGAPGVSDRPLLTLPQGVQSLAAALAPLVLELNAGANPRSGIAYRGFEVGCTALFLPTPHGHFLAFNVGAPNHFLARESAQLIGHDPHFTEFYILGRVVQIERRTATNGSGVGSDHYQLPRGCDYAVLTVMAVSAECTPPTLLLPPRAASVC
ncbi:hypothetical protein JKP88DRAFT_51369, partial [Tribonema minus]